MIPLRDTVRSRRFPVVTVAIIVVNFLVFFYQMTLFPRAQNAFIIRWSIIPALGFFVQPWRLVTSAFLHGGWGHILGNMLYVWIFGDNVEDQLGHGRFLLFYLAMAILAGAIQVVSDPSSTVPVIGASGAVAGILGAYFICIPNSKIVTLIPIIFFFSFIEIPSYIYLFIWFILQLFSGVSSIGGATSVAWWAHIGGFMGGVLFVKMFKKKEQFPY